MVPPLALALEEHDEWVARNRRASFALKYYRKIKNWVDVWTIAHVTFTVILDSLGRGASIATKISTLAVNIGRTLEDQAFIAYMESVDPRYFKKLTKYYLNDPVRRYDKKVYAMKNAMNRHDEMEWEFLTEKEQAKVGMYLLSFVLTMGTGSEGEALFEKRAPVFDDPQRANKKKKTHADPNYLGFTLAGLKYRDKIQQACDEGTWKPMPMVCKPLDWVYDPETDEVTRGGYILPVPGKNGDLIHDNKGSKPSPAVMDALNRLQRTPYKINTYMLDIQKQLTKGTWEIGNWRSYEQASYEDEHRPLYDSDWLDSLDKEGEDYKDAMRTLMTYYHDQRIDEQRSGSPRRTLILGEMFRDEPEIYTPWFLDTRGRVYPVVEGLSPQGPDWQKCLLRPAHGVPINEDTEEELLISIATAGAFEKVDKKSFEDRLEWARTYTSEPAFALMCEDPYGYKHWHDADEPWQFLAFCREYYELFVAKTKDVCEVFVFRDATNSGLQILAGLMRDEKSAHYTNVLPTDSPKDAYGLVADTAKDLMRDEAWLDNEFDIRAKDTKKKNAKRDKDNQIEDRGKTFEFPIDVLNRDHTKTQVMTTLYNSSMLTRRDNILDALKKKAKVEVHPGDKGIVTHACVQGMAQEFEKALELNKWFQKVAKSAMANDRDSLTWFSPSGMFVNNEYRQPLYKQISTYAMGGGHYDNMSKNDIGYIYLQNGWGDVQPGKVMSATSANFIHSLDASIIHLGMNDLPEDIPVFTVHDCIASVPGTLKRVIPVFRRAYLNVVTSEPLMGLLEENEIEEIKPPQIGNADIEQCLLSPYMFC